MSAFAGNRAVAQTDDLPDAADGFTAMAPVAPPPLRFTDAKGHVLTLANYRGHVLVVNFWATWCGPCVDELPTLAALAGKVHTFGGLVLPISVDTNGAKAVEPFLGLHGITDLPVLLDPDGDNLDLLGSEGVPITLVINAEGQIAARVDGAVNWNTPRVVAFLKSLVPTGQNPAPAHIMAL